MNEIKQVICIRKDLGMRKGKCVAQGCHASVTICVEQERNWDPDYGYPNKIYEEWINGLQTKICVSVSSEQELCEVYQQARAAGLLCSLITDAGKTEFGGIPTKTAVAIGPDRVEEIDKITGKLPLL